MWVPKGLESKGLELTMFRVIEGNTSGSKDLRKLQSVRISEGFELNSIRARDLAVLVNNTFLHF